MTWGVLGVASLAGAVKGIFNCGAALDAAGFVHVSQGLGPSPGTHERQTSLPFALDLRGERIVSMTATVLPHNNVTEKRERPAALCEGHAAGSWHVDVAPVD